MTRLSPSTVCCRACAPWPPGSAMLMPLGRRAESQTPMAACGALAAASHRFRSPVRRGNPGHRHNRQSHAEKMSRLQDALPGDPQRAWQRRPNPLLLNPLRFAPESTAGHWEGDLIICKRTRPVLVLHERKSRVTLAARLAGKTAAETISVM